MYVWIRIESACVEFLYTVSLYSIESNLSFCRKPQILTNCVSCTLDGVPTYNRRLCCQFFDVIHHLTC